MSVDGVFQLAVHLIIENVLRLLNTLITDMTGDTGDQYISLAFITSTKGTLDFFLIFHKKQRRIRKFKRKLKKIVQILKLFGLQACVLKQKRKKYSFLFLSGQNFIDHSIGFGFLRSHPVITI